MLIHSLSYEHFKENGFHVGNFTLSPQEGDIDFPESTEADIPEIVGIFLRKAFGVNILEGVYKSQRYSSVFTVKYARGDMGISLKFMVSPDNYKQQFKIKD